MRKFLPLIAIFCALCSLPACKVLYPNLMFQQKDYKFFELREQEINQYIIKPGDQFSIRVFSRDGFKLLDIINSNSTDGSTGNISSGSNAAANQNNTTTTGFLYLVDHDGYAKLPIVGEVYVKGYSESELERFLQERFALFFVEPFVDVRVANRRAFVFSGANATVVPLNQAPTNLLEVIAKAGGIATNLKAYKVKIIRGDLKNPEVVLIDLSTIEGLKNANLTVQSNDIIYIEQRKRVVSDGLNLVIPLVTISTTLTTLYLLVKQLGK
jgi:polysaccharide export outer membrane protein